MDRGAFASPASLNRTFTSTKVLLASSIPVNRSGLLDEAIEILGERKRTYSTDDIVERAGQINLSALANGVTRVRTHVDIDSSCGLIAFEAMLAVRERFGGPGRSADRGLFRKRASWATTAPRPCSEKR